MNSSSQLEPSSPSPPSALPVSRLPHSHSSMRGGAESVDTFDMWFAMDFRRIFRRRWPLIVIPALLLSALSLGYVLKKAPSYTAVETVLLLSRDGSSNSSAAAALEGATGLLPGSLASAAAGDGTDPTTQCFVVESDHTLNQVAHQLHLPYTPAQLRGMVDAQPDKSGANILDITVKASAPLLAKQIAQTTVAVYQNDQSDETATVMGNNAKTVRAQVADARKNLNAAEDELVAFNHHSGTLDADADASKRVDSLYALGTELNDAQQKLSADKAEHGYLASESTKLPVAIVPNLTFERNPRIESDKATLAQLESDRARLGAEYTPKDPEMIANQQAINTVQQHMVSERQAEDSSVGASMAGGISGKVDPGFDIATGTRQLNPEAQNVAQQLVQNQADTEAEAATVSAIKDAISSQNASNQGIPDVARREGDLKDTVTLDQRLYDDLRAQYQSLEAQRGEDQVYAKVLEPAMLPLPVSWLKNALIVLAAALGGLVAGVLFMLGAEAGDKRVRSPLDIQVDLGLPVLTTVPQLGVAKALPSSQRLLDSTQSAVSVRRLASSLAFMGLGTRFRSVLLTSAVPGEGVTFITSQLAIELARQGQRVVLVDANLRSPSLHSFFGLENTAGLAAAMRNGGHPETSLVPLSESRPLEVVSSGDLDNEAATQVLNNSVKLSTLLSSLLERADIVLIDTSAVLDGVETAMLAAAADATLLVTAEGYANREDVRRAAALLGSAQAPLLGVVVNESGSGRLRPV